MDKTTKRLRLNGAYVFDEDFFERIHRLLHEYVDSISIKVGLSDGSEISSKDFEVLKRIENTKARRIESIKFSSGYNDSIDITVDILSSLLGDIEIRVSGSDADCLRFCDKASQIFLTAKQWYSLISKPPFMLPYILSGLGSGTFLGVVFRETSFVLPFGVTKGQLVAASSVLALLPMLHYWARQYLFPTVIFAIGDGKRFLRGAEKLRGILFGAILLAIVGNVAASYIYDHLK
ncbi:MAG: hypothetical protein ACK4FJ_05045 [Ferrovibrio sp.]|uniref:hypothetical protein n=1 Tax=Ferrovibrio sp. TaxID=1917215 RepID=UPI00391B661C